jgi:hypothetical protein
VELVMEPPAPPPPLPAAEDPAPADRPRRTERGPRSTKFIPDPLHPATELLRSLAEESLAELQRRP